MAGHSPFWLSSRCHSCAQVLTDCRLCGSPPLLNADDNDQPACWLMFPSKELPNSDAHPSTVIKGMWLEATSRRSHDRTLFVTGCVGHWAHAAEHVVSTLARVHGACTLTSACPCPLILPSFDPPTTCRHSDRTKVGNCLRKGLRRTIITEEMQSVVDTDGTAAWVLVSGQEDSRIRELQAIAAHAAHRTVDPAGRQHR